MKKTFAIRSHNLFVFAVFVLLSSTLTAQTVSSKTVKAKKQPFAVGEVLSYEGKWSRIILPGISVAEMTFRVENDASNPKGKTEKINFTADANSKGSLVKLVGINVTQKINSTVDANDFSALQTVRHDVQGKRVRDGKAVFDYLARTVAYNETDPNDLNRPARMIASPLESSAQDILSAFYFIRLQPLAVGDSFTVPVSDSGVVFQIPVRVTAREKQKTIFGNIWTLKVEPEVFGDKRLVAGNGKMTIWFTDDARHIPVRSQIEAKIGKVEVKLRRAEGLSKI